MYCSSPEPEPVRELDAWNDMMPDDSDEEMDDEVPNPENPVPAGESSTPTLNGDSANKPKEEPKIEPGTENDGSAVKNEDRKPPPLKFTERPKTPDMETFGPICIRAVPKQLVNSREVDKDPVVKEEKFDCEIARAKAKSFLPIRTNGSLTSITMTLKSGNGASERVLRALNGLAKLMKIEAPKQWIVEDSKNGIRDVFKTRKAPEVESDPMELMSVLTHGHKLCRKCETVLKGEKVVFKSSELPFLSKQEVEDCEEVFFCNSQCYFEFATKRTGNKIDSSVKNLDDLKDLQTKEKEELERQEKIKEEEEEAEIKAEESHKGKAYKSWSTTLTQTRKHKKLNDKELTEMMFRIGLTLMPSRDVDDQRECLFCHLKGDAAADGPGRLLNYDVDKWVHLNCALWSEEVYETVSGALVNVTKALESGEKYMCKLCEKSGATVKCWKVRCTNYYHVGCATKDRAMFYKNKSVYCHQHIPKGEKDQELTTLSVYRRVYIEQDENRQVAKVMTQGADSQYMRIGTLTFLAVGQLLPHQLQNFHNADFIYPIGFKIERLFWSITEVNKRCPYICTIAEVEGKPEFRVIYAEGKKDERVFKDSTARAAWTQVIEIVEKQRRENDLTKVFPEYILGEDLFGLTEPNVVKVLESLPGIESLVDYNFKYGRNPLLELPLAVNPSGCARAEPKMRTNVKRVHNFQRTTGSRGGSDGNKLNRAAKENVSIMIGLETTGPYSKNFVQSKSSQFRKMKQEWRQNVVLARSKIQGLGLYAARDLEKHSMIIEYIGEVIRGELTDIREKRYDEQNRGTYMFRLDDSFVLDATMKGGMARYVNHSCNPNCFTDVVEVDRESHIIIFANRKIMRGEELCYDYKFDFEDDNRIPCLCGAPNCRKWMN